MCLRNCEEKIACSRYRYFSLMMELEVIFCLEHRDRFEIHASPYRTLGNGLFSESVSVPASEWKARSGSGSAFESKYRSFRGTTWSPGGPCTADYRSQFRFTFDEDPDPHQSEKSDPNKHCEVTIQIRIRSFLGFFCSFLTVGTFIQSSKIPNLSLRSHKNPEIKVLLSLIFAC